MNVDLEKYPMPQLIKVWADSGLIQKKNSFNIYTKGEKIKFLFNLWYRAFDYKNFYSMRPNNKIDISYNSKMDRIIEQKQKIRNVNNRISARLADLFFDSESYKAEALAYILGLDFEAFKIEFNSIIESVMKNEERTNKIK